jgi:predicted nuclease of predicted toxin-antitoxin system
MQVLCDVHMPYRLVNQLRERGVDATHVNRILDGSETKVISGKGSTGV